MCLREYIGVTKHSSSFKTIKMNYSNTDKTNRPKGRTLTADQFEQAYVFTLNNLSRTTSTTSNAPLQILQLLVDCPRNHTIYALELWLFCEARKIFNTIKKTQLRQKAIRQQIVQRFVMQLAPEKRKHKKAHVQSLINNILEKMGFSKE